MSEYILSILLKGTWETLFMTFVSGFFSFLIRLPLRICLFLSRQRHLLADKTLFRTLAFMVNVFRAIPFIILIVWMIPFTRMVVGTSIGMQAAIVPLSIGAAPFVA